MNTANIARFITKGNSVFHFLALVTFFSILLVVFGQPVGILRHTTQTSTLHPLMQIACTVAAGVLVVVISRIAISLSSKQITFSPLGIAIWLLAEMIVCVATMLLTLWGVSGGGRIYHSLAALSGDITLGTITVEAIPYIIAYLVYRLQDEHAEVERLKALLPAEGDAEHLPSDANINFYDKGGRLSFATQRGNVLYIEAANNYANIHYINDGKEDTFILHNTLKDLENSLRSKGMVRCHRCYMVNLDNVKLMRKDGSGLMLELSGCTKNIPVTKTFSAAVTSLLESHTPEI